MVVAGGATHLSDLDHGSSTGRPLTFVVGLDADRFPGSGIQDPILTHADRVRLAPGDLPTSIERVAERRWDLAAMLARLRGGTVTLSWGAWSPGDSRDVASASAVLQAFRLLEGTPRSTTRRWSGPV